MNKKILIILLIAIVLPTLTSCAPFESNYYSFEKDWVNASKTLKVSQGIIPESFYTHNTIHNDRAYKMKDNLYLIYYYNPLIGKTEDKFQEVIEDYKKDASSLSVYLVESNESYIEFVSRVGKNYAIEDIWYDPFEIEELPYRLDK